MVGNKINADAGLFDTDLMTRIYGPKIGEKWAKDRLRDGLDQIIAHEHAEASGISHAEAVHGAAETPLTIREKARGKGSGRWQRQKGDARGAETFAAPPTQRGKLEDAIIALRERPDRFHDPRPCQFTAVPAIGVGDLMIARQVSRRRSPCLRASSSRSGSGVPQSAEVCLGGGEQLVSPRPASLGEPEIRPVRLHDPGLDEFAEGIAVALSDRQTPAP